MKKLFLKFTIFSCAFACLIGGSFALAERSVALADESLSKEKIVNPVQKCLDIFTTESFTTALDQKPTLRQALIKNVESQTICGQEDSALKKKRYVLKHGGLCAPTTANIILSTLDQRVGIPTIASANETIRLTDHASRISHEDARKGLDLDDLLRLIQIESEKRGHAIRFEANTLNSALNSWAKRRNLEKPERKSIGKTILSKDNSNSLFIIGTEVYSLKETPPKFVWGHVSIGFNFDPENMTLQIVDTLHPNHFYNAKLIPAVEPQTDKKTFQVILDESIPGYTDHPEKMLIYLTEVIRIQVR